MYISFISSMKPNNKLVVVTEHLRQFLSSAKQLSQHHNCLQNSSEEVTVCHVSMKQSHKFRSELWVLGNTFVMLFCSRKLRTRCEVWGLESSISRRSSFSRIGRDRKELVWWSWRSLLDGQLSKKKAQKSSIGCCFEGFPSGKIQVSPGKLICHRSPYSEYTRRKSFIQLPH